MGIVDRIARRALHKVAQPVLQQGQREFGLGDVAHGLTHRAGIKHCSKCAQKKEAMNKKMRFVAPR
jgi:hypothetical protein